MSNRRKSKSNNTDEVGESVSSGLRFIQDELRVRYSQNSISPALHGYEEERR